MTTVQEKELADYLRSLVLDGYCDNAILWESDTVWRAYDNEAAAVAAYGYASGDEVWYDVGISGGVTLELPNGHIYIALPPTSNKGW